MNNDARSKLRSMGGIMASSPELMQVAQKFQAGGRVSAGPSPLRTIPTVRQPEMPELGPRNPVYDPKIFRSGTIDPVLSGTRRVAPLSPTQVRRNAILERAAAGSPTYGSGAQRFPSSPDMPFEPRVPMGPEAGFPERAADRVIENLIAGEISSLEQEEITLDDLLDVSISRGIPIQELVDMMPEGVKPKLEASEGPVAKIAQTKAPREEQSAEFRSNVYGSVKNLASNFYEGALSDVAGFSQQGLGIGLDVLGGAASLFGMDKISASLERQSDRLYNKAVSNIRQGVSATAGMNPNDFDLEPEQFSALLDAAEATEDARKEAGAPALSPEETVMAQPLVPKKLDQSVIDKMLDLAKKDPNVPFGTETPTPDGDQTPTGDEDTPTGDQAPPPPPPKPTKRDLRSRYNEKLELFKEIYGTDDKDEAQDRAMSLAMIGLAIAAGQSPNALTNIAQGAMVGLQGMGAQREAERERERGLKTLALQTAIDQMGAETEAEAEAAKMDYDRQTRLMVEREKNRGGSSSSPFEKFPTVADLIAKEQNTIDAAIEQNPSIVPEQYKDNPNAWKDLELKRRGKRYVIQSLPQMPEDQRQGLLLAGQELLYQYPEDPSLRIVQNNNDLMFIMPGQKFAQLDPKTREYSVKIKRVDPETGGVTVVDAE